MDVQFGQAAGEVTPKPDRLNCNWKPDDVHVKVKINKTAHPSCDERRQYYAENGITYSQLEREVHADDLCEGIQYSCLFRDPISLIQSNINFEYELGFAANSSIRVSHMRDLVSKGLVGAANEADYRVGLSPHIGWKFMDNMQTRLLSGAIDVPPAQVTREHLEMAKRRLAKFHVVERLENIMDPVKRGRFFGKMGWNITMDDSFQSNPSKESDELTEEDKLWLKDLNKYDYELYRYVGDLVSA